MADVKSIRKSLADFLEKSFGLIDDGIKVNLENAVKQTSIRMQQEKSAAERIKVVEQTAAMRAKWIDGFHAQATSENIKRMKDAGASKFLERNVAVSGRDIIEFARERKALVSKLLDKMAVETPGVAIEYAKVPWDYKISKAIVEKLPDRAYARGLPIELTQWTPKFILMRAAAFFSDYGKLPDLPAPIIKAIERSASIISKYAETGVRAFGALGAVDLDTLDRMLQEGMKSFRGNVEREMAYAFPKNSGEAAAAEIPEKQPSMQQATPPRMKQGELKNAAGMADAEDLDKAIRGTTFESLRPFFERITLKLQQRADGTKRFLLQNLPQGITAEDVNRFTAKILHSELNDFYSSTPDQLSDILKDAGMSFEQILPIRSEISSLADDPGQKSKLITLNPIVYDKLHSLLKDAGMDGRISPESKLLGIAREYVYEDFGYEVRRLAKESISRPTPQAVTKATQRIILSGGAAGADAEWAKAGAATGAKTLALSFKAHQTYGGEKIELTPEQLRAADPHLTRANAVLGRRFPTSSEFVNNLLRRNYYQVRKAEAVYAIAQDLDEAKGVVEGGTGWAVQMAQDLGKTAYVFSQRLGQWFKIAANKVSKIAEPPPLPAKFAGIGTRGLTQVGRDAIMRVVKASGPLASGLAVGLGADIALSAATSVAEAAGLKSMDDAIDAINTSTLTQGRQSHPADLSKQPSMRATPPGGLKSPAVIGDTPESRMEAVARGFAESSAAAGERTRKFFSAHPVLVESARSFANYVNTGLSLWNRFLYTQGKMLQDGPSFGEHALRMQLDPTYMAKALEVWNRPEAKEYRFHTLDIGEHMGRMIFTAHRLAAGGFDMRDTARAKEFYQSAEAGDWVNKHGAMIVDLPLSIVFDLANPAFAAFTGARVVKHFDYLRSQVKRVAGTETVRGARDVHETRHMLMAGAGATGIGEETSEIVFHAVRAGRQEAAVNLLHRMGYREPGPLDRLGLRWLRIPGKAYSTIEQEHILENSARLRRADAITKMQIERSEPLRKFFETADSRDIFQFSLIVQDEKNLHRWAEGVVNGTHMPFSEKVNDAVNVWNQVAAGDMIARKKNWATESGVITSMGRIEKKMATFFEMQGMDPTRAKIKSKVTAAAARAEGGLPASVYSEMPPELRAYILRQLDPTTPPVLPWYWKKVWDEGVAGKPIPKWQTRLRQNQEFKSYITGLVGQPLTAQQMQLRREYFGNLMALDAQGRLREVWIEKLSGLARAAGDEQGEAAWKLIGAHIDKDVFQIRLNPAALYGGQDNKDRVLYGLGELRKLASNAGKAAEHINDPIAFLDVFSKSVRQFKLFFPFSHFIANNAVNNALKNLFARGWRGFTDLVKPSSRFSILGEDLDFMGNFMPARDIASTNLSHITLPKALGGKKITGVLDLPGLGWYNDALNAVNTPIEYWTRNFPGRAVYKEAVESIDKAARAAGRTLSSEQLDRAGRGIAQTFVNATQFVPYHAPMIAWWDRISTLTGDISFGGFRVQDLAFSARIAMEHPTIPTALMRVQDAMAQSSVRGTGEIELGKSGLVMDVDESVPIMNTIDMMRRVAAPEIGPTLSETAIKIAKSVDAFAGELGRMPLHFATPVQILAGQITPGTEDMEQVSRKDAKAAMAGSRQMFPGLADAVLAVTGKNLYEFHIGEGDVSKSIDRIHEERVHRGQVAEQRAAFLRGDDIPQDDEARSLYLKHDRINSGIKSFLGVKMRYDPDQSRAQVQQAMDWYYSLDRSGREHAYNTYFLPDGRTKFFEGLVTRPEYVPVSNPDKKLFDQFGKETDQEKLKELYHDMTPRQQKGLLENMFDKTWNVIDRLRSEVRSEIGVGTASAAEIPADTLASEPNIKAYLEALPNKVDKTAAIRQVGEPQEGGKLLSWFDFSKIEEDLKQAKISGPLLRKQIHQMHELDFKLNNSVKAIVSMWGNAQTPEEQDAIFTLPNGKPREYLPVQAQNGETVQFPMKLLFNQGPNEPVTKSRFVQTLQHAVDVGLMRSTEKDPSRTPVLYGDNVNKVREVLAFVTLKKRQDTMLIRMKERQRNSALDMLPLMEQIKSTILHPDSINDAAKLAKVIDDNIENGSALVPKDFYRRVVSGGVPGAERTLAEFAIAIKARSLDNLYSAIRAPNRDGSEGHYISEKAVDAFIAGGWGPELQILATKDRDLAKYIRKHGGVDDPDVVGGEALYLFAAQKGIPITRDLFTRARLTEPREGEFVQFDRSLEPWPEKDERGETILRGHPELTGAVRVPRPQEAARGDDLQFQTQAMQEAQIQGRTPLLEAAAGMIPVDKFQIKYQPRFVPQGNIPSFGPVGSVTEFVRKSARGAADFNDAQKKLEQEFGLTGKPLRTNMFTVAAHNLGSLDPSTAAYGAYGIMQLGNALGFVGNDDVRIVRRGLYQSMIMGAGLGAADLTLTVGGHAAAYFRGKEYLDPRKRIGPPTQAESITAGRVAMAGYAGSALTLGAGLAAGFDAPQEVSIGMGAAGGALQGAALGTQFAPGYGTVIGAVIGAALGGFMGSQRDEKGEDYAELRALQQARLRQEIANAEERQKAFREEREARGIQAKERALTVPAGRRAPTARDQLYNFLRRPTFASSQGLVRQVEGLSGRALTPRW